jgi:hypothetical protein
MNWSRGGVSRDRAGGGSVWNLSPFQNKPNIRPELKSIINEVTGVKKASQIARTALLGAVQVLHCTALHCTALHCTALHCTALHCTAPHCTALKCTALH